MRHSSHRGGLVTHAHTHTHTHTHKYIFMYVYVYIDADEEEINSSPPCGTEELNQLGPPTIWRGHHLGLHQTCDLIISGNIKLC
jgi:hypothetical protein